MDLISRQAAIDAIRASTKKYTGLMEMEMYTDDDAVEAIEALPSAQQDVTDTNVGDMINRQVAISRAVTITMFGRDIRVVGVSELESLPSAQPDLDEWCTDCKEYDKERHSCPRFNRVIREALKDAQPERKTGEWILSDAQNPEDVRNGNYAYTCSNCLYSDIHAKTAVVPFCWHCGADMSGADMREEN